MSYLIDITQLVHWPGNLTGIPRVMDELALRFLQHDDSEVVFVSWVKEIGQMCEVDFAKTRLHRGDGISYISKTSPIGTVSPSTPNFAKSLPLTISATKNAKKALKKAAIKSRLDRTSLYKKTLSTKRNLELQSYKPYVPVAKDKLFIPWGEWWDQNWLNLMKDFASDGVHLYPVCHDILPMIVPQFSGNSSSLKEFVSQIFPLSKSVLTVSESTKKDLSNWMKENGLSVPPIKVFRLGENFTLREAGSNTDIAKKYGVQKEAYIVYVSTIEPRKNHAVLYYTYKLARSRGVTLPKLLIIGRVGHNSDEIIRLISNDPDVMHSVDICNDVDDTDLNWLYENCLFSINPSFYEGWGMPVLESIARGKPVICSSTSSLLEMPKDCVMFFNPASTDECLEALTEMMKPSVLKKYRNNAKKYTLHTWDDSFKQVVDILKEK